MVVLKYTKFGRQMNYNYYKSDILVQPVFITGAKSSGKSLIYSFIKSYASIEGVCKDFFVNHLLQLNASGEIPNRVVDVQLKFFLDFKYYESVIGRNLNSRVGDETSIWNSPHVKRDFTKLFSARGIGVATDISSRTKSYLIDSHNLLLYTETLDRIYKDYYLINVTRSPASILTSWVRDEFYADKVLRSKLSQTLCVETSDGLVPLLLPPSERIRFVKSDLSNRCAIVFFHVHAQAMKAQHRLRKSSNVLNISFEKALLAPHETYDRISKYLSHAAYENICDTYRQENVPRSWSFENELIKLKDLKSMLSMTNFTILHDFFDIWAEQNGYG
jgi:hypothetical protein